MVAVEKEAQDEVSRNKTRILIVSDHPTICQRLIELINQEPDIGNCIEANDTNQTFDTISKQQVDLAIIDVSLKDTKGFKLADKIKLQCPNLPIVVLSLRRSTSVI